MKNGVKVSWSALEDFFNLRHDDFTRLTFPGFAPSTDPSWVLDEALDDVDEDCGGFPEASCALDERVFVSDDREVDVLLRISKIPRRDDAFLPEFMKHRLVSSR